VQTVRRLLLVLAASLVLAGAFGSVVGTSPVGAVAHRATAPSTRSAPSDPRLCTIGQRCAPSVPGNPAGPVGVPGTLGFLSGLAVVVALPRHRRRVGRRWTTSGDFTPGIFRPPIASLA
jgi:hypothetical protein